VSHSLEGKSFSEAILSKFIDPKELTVQVSQLRSLGKTIATLNGSFDLLHAGHLEMIYQASLQADILIVGLNTDRSIQEYKSPKRPIIPLKERMQMMAALCMVDYVTYFDEIDPREMLKKVNPDVHVNGSEYGQDCIEAATVKEGGGRIHIVSLIPGLSTSQIITKIVQVCTS
jgi:rfaE bifunctional protein nucleotidyltransferase chain/domain